MKASEQVWHLEEEKARLQQTVIRLQRERDEARGGVYEPPDGEVTFIGGPLDLTRQRLNRTALDTRTYYVPVMNPTCSRYHDPYKEVCPLCHDRPIYERMTYDIVELRTGSRRERVLVGVARG